MSPTNTSLLHSPLSVEGVDCEARRGSTFKLSDTAKHYTIEYSP
jgi:hypothetical protein